MSKFLNTKYAGLKAYIPGEQPKDMKYIKLNTNESPFPPGPGVMKAIDRDEVERLRLYSDPECLDLKKKLAGLYNMRKENIYVASGSDDILNFAFMAFADEKTGVMFPDPSYGFYKVFADLCDVPAEKVPLREDFSVDPKDYYCKNKLIVIANPNAPTGKTLTVRQIEEIVRTNPESVVVIDEAYVDFGANTCVDLVFKYDNLLVVQTFSKSRCLAGARLGFAISSPAIIGDLEKLKFSTNPYNVNRLTCAAGIAAINENDYYMDKCAEIEDIREYTAQSLENMGFKVIPSKANFLFVTNDKIKGEELYLSLRNKGILIRHFDDEKISDYNRITIGTKEDMETFLRATQELLMKK